MNDTTLLLLVGLIFLGIGFALGLAVALLRTPREEPAKKERVETAVENVAKTLVPEPTPQVTPAAQSKTSTGQLPVLQPVVAETAPSRSIVNPINVFTRAIQADVRPAPAPPKSIAAQVDEVLQEMLKESTLETRAIRLLELPGKGMVVMVGLDQYDGVNAVPDEAIRSLLKAAVAEWEKRAEGQTP